MQRRRRSAAGHNGVVRHLLCAVGHAPLQKHGLELPLVGRLLGPLDDGLVRRAGHGVGLADHGHLELVLDDARSLDGGLEQLKVLVLEADKGDVVGDLARDGVDCRGGVCACEVGERGVDVGGELHLVDVVELEGVVDGGGQAGPDDIVGVDWGDEERGFGGGDVVGEEAVGEVAAGEVVEVAALSARRPQQLAGYTCHGRISQILSRAGAEHSIPEGLGRVVVLEELRVAALEIEHAAGLGVLFADEVDDAAGVRLARVLALEHGFKVFGNHFAR